MVKSFMYKWSNYHFTDVFHWIWIVNALCKNKMRNESLLQSKDLQGKFFMCNLIQKLLTHEGPMVHVCIAFSLFPSARVSALNHTVCPQVCDNNHTWSASQTTEFRWSAVKKGSGPGDQHLGFRLCTFPMAFLSRDTDWIQHKLPLHCDCLEGN